MLWIVLLLSVLMYLLLFLSNYLKQIKIGNHEPNPDDYWKYSYDVKDPKEFNDPIPLDNITYTPVRQDGATIQQQKKFKDRLVNCYWGLVFVIFYLVLYLIAGLMV